MSHGNYLDDFACNSRENIYSGYPISEFDDQFQGTRYIFTLGENEEAVASTLKLV